MALENCGKNVDRGHGFAMWDYGTAYPPDDAYVYARRLAFQQFDLKETTETVVDDGISENIHQHAGDEIIVAKRVSGTVRLNPRAEDTQALCRPIFGGADFSANEKLPGPICEYFGLGHADPYNDIILNYENLVVSEATFSAQERGLLNLSMNVEGQQRTVLSGVTVDGSSPNVGVWPEDLVLSEQQPWAMRQGVLTLNFGSGAVARQFKNFSLVVNNGIASEDFFNSMYRKEMPSSLQTIRLTHDSPWDVAADIAALGTLRNAACELTFTSGTKVLKFTFPYLVGVQDEPGISSGQGRILNQFVWNAKKPPQSPTPAINAPVKIRVVTA